MDSSPPTIIKTTSIQESRPILLVSAVILSYQNNKLVTLLNRFLLHDKWLIPSGFIRNGEGLKDALRRIIDERSGIKGIALTQVGTYGWRENIHAEENKRLMDHYKITLEQYPSAFDKFVTVCYLGLIMADKVKIEHNENEETAWFDLTELPPMYADHGYIIERTLKQIRYYIYDTPTIKDILPEKYTISELKEIYEAILGKKLDRSNFKRKLLQSDTIIQLNERKEVNTYPKPLLFRCGGR